MGGGVGFFGGATGRGSEVETTGALAGADTLVVDFGLDDEVGTDAVEVEGALEDGGSVLTVAGLEGAGVLGAGFCVATGLEAGVTGAVPEEVGSALSSPANWGPGCG